MHRRSRRQPGPTSRRPSRAAAAASETMAQPRVNLRASGRPSAVHRRRRNSIHQNIEILRQAIQPAQPQDIGPRDHKLASKSLPMSAPMPARRAGFVVVGDTSADTDSVEQRDQPGIRDLDGEGVVSAEQVGIRDVGGGVERVDPMRALVRLDGDDPLV